MFTKSKRISLPFPLIIPLIITPILFFISLFLIIPYLNENKINNINGEKIEFERNNFIRKNFPPLPQSPDIPINRNVKREMEEKMTEEMNELNNNNINNIEIIKELLKTSIEISLNELYKTQPGLPYPSSTKAAELLLNKEREDQNLGKLEEDHDNNNEYKNNNILTKLKLRGGNNDIGIWPDYSTSINLLKKILNLFENMEINEIKNNIELYFITNYNYYLLNIAGENKNKCNEYMYNDNKITTLKLNGLKNEHIAYFFLLNGYCQERLHYNKNQIVYSYEKAREFNPNIHETFLDQRYVPANYQTYHMRNIDNPYIQPLFKLLVFRELYGQYIKFNPNILEEDVNEYNNKLPTAIENELKKPKYLSEVAKPYPMQWGFNDELLKEAGPFFQENHFTVLKNFLHPFELAVIYDYYEYGSDHIPEKSFDPGLSRYVSYNDRIGIFMNSLMENVVRKIAGKDIKHAYAFLCGYQKQSESSNKAPTLRAHTDREDNDFTISIQLYSEGYDNNNNLIPNVHWPIYVNPEMDLPPRSTWRPKSKVGISAPLNNGDAVFFRGRMHNHWREDMRNEIKIVYNLLLHYVENDFDFFDYKLVRQAKDPSI